MTTTSAPPQKAETLNGRTVSQYLNQAVMELAAKQQAIPPQVAELTRCLLVRTNGTVQVTKVDQLIGHLVSLPARPGKFWPQGNMLAPEAALADFFALGECWLKMRDEDVWAAAAKAATKATLTGNELRALSRAVQAALGIRAGLASPTMQEMV